MSQRYFFVAVLLLFSILANASDADRGIEVRNAGRSEKKISADTQLEAINAISNALVNSINKQDQIENKERQRETEQMIIDSKRKADIDRIKSAEAEKKADSKIDQVRQSTNDPFAAAIGADDDSTKSIDCDCRFTVSECRASIRLDSVTDKSTQKVSSFSAEYTVSSNQNCAKVEYYINNTPYFTILNNQYSSKESTFGTFLITAKSFEVISCKICKR